MSKYNLVSVSNQHLWLIKLRYLWLGIQTLLITVALLYGYLDKRTFSIIFPLSILILLINIKLHQNINHNKKKSPLLDYQVQGDLVLFVIFLLFSGGTQNPFYPFFYLLVILLGISTNSKEPWINGLIVLAASFSLQIIPYISLYHVSILSSQTSPYLLIQFAIPLITFFIAHSLGKRLNDAHAILEKIQRKEDRMSRLKALGAMSAGLCHEFASPLHAAQLRLERIKRIHGSNDDVSESILALEDCSRTLHLIGKVHRELDSTVVEKINELNLREIIDQWHQANPEVELKLDLQSFHINSPKLSFIQTVINILDNAREAQEDYPVIEVHSFNNLGINIMTIQDSGPGIPLEVINRWGQPFNNHRTGGTGLGLYSCELFMNSLGGEFTVKNTSNGACVELKFL